MVIDAKGMHFEELNSKVRSSSDKKVEIENCMGQRYIGAGLKDFYVCINGTPGNALGAYLDGAEITVFGNAQDASGDTMNDGKIVVHGNSGDATGYAMRGGKIYVSGNAGYRAGIHMKEYKDKLPVLVIGGSTGSFLGEYQAGGIIIVLGLATKGIPIGSFCGAGLHGGKIFVRSNTLPDDLPSQISAEKARPADLAEIEPFVKEFSSLFGHDKDSILSNTFYVLKPNTTNPYNQLYTHN